MKYHKDQYLLFGLQVIAHISLVFVIIFGNIVDYLTVLFSFFLLGCVGTTVTYHRLLSHKSWTSPRWFTVIGSVLGCLSLIGSPIAWVALHRQHHRYTDKPGDPHSPKDGFWHSQWGTIFETPNLKYVPDLLRDPLQVFLHKNYFLIQFFVLLVLLLLNPWLIATTYLAPAALVMTLGSLNNSIAHSNFGYRNYDTADNSRNVPLLAILMWGEGWHNNHHANPSNYSFSKNWWEVDIGNWVVKQVNIKK